MDLADDLHRLTDQSRVRVAAAEARREEQQLIVRRCARLIDEGRRLLQGRDPTTGV